MRLGSLRVTSPSREARMDVEWSLLLPLIAVLVLAILETGPGMWSDKLGWWWLRNRKDRR
jgi:hypothetical protein